MRVRKIRSTIVAGVIAMALSILPAFDAWSIMFCVHVHDGSCHFSSSCDHYDADGNWIGHVYIQYQC